MLEFIQRNNGWHAEPNAPNPEVSTAGKTLLLRFALNPWIGGANQGERGVLTFPACRQWRLGPTNDEGWYLGECRYVRQAPHWGEFYELIGTDDLRDAPNDWVLLESPKDDDRHFLFYFRDETFECVASSWSYEKSRENSRP